MLYPTAGSRLYIMDAPSGWSVVSPGVWVEIGETEALGTLGIEWQTEQDIVKRDGVGPDIGCQTVKSHLQPSAIQVIMGNDPADPGQIILWRAARASEEFPFRLVLPDGETERHWSALVTRLVDVFDTANNVLKLQADLLPVSNLCMGDA